jgi:NAD(P)-dependent dehydrogenase (short-subunit alcohol dehydrogenase family)
MPATVSIVSGGSRGLGLAIVESLLARGDSVATFSRSGSAELDALAASAGERLVAASVDAADPAAIRRFVAGVVERFGRIDHCIANAAIACEGVLATTSDADIAALLAVNLGGSIVLARECVRQMLVPPSAPASTPSASAPFGSASTPSASASPPPAPAPPYRVSVSPPSVSPPSVSASPSPVSASTPSVARLPCNRESASPSITLVSSIVAAKGSPGLSVYAATKAGLEGFARSLARELGPRGIRVNCVAPGFLETDLSASLSAENRGRIARRTALGRLGTPADVVGAIDYLTSPAAAFITAQVLTIDGGT